METLIRFRLLASQLQKDEMQHFIQEIVNAHGVDKIIAFIFDQFFNEYKQNKHIRNDLLNITNIISTIINSRQNLNSSEKDFNKIIPNTIHQLPSDLIGKCSSYLCLNDYINFMKTNRIIYCGSNSPITLQKLNIIKHNIPSDFTRFSMVKTFCIQPNVYNQNQTSQFSHLNKLHINNRNADENDIELFMKTDKIDFSKITHLKLENFGTDENTYDFDAFCHLLTQFTDVTHLELQQIYLTDFNPNNDNIKKMTPKLQVLDCFMLSGLLNLSANLLRNNLMNMYSKQLIQLSFDEDEDPNNVYSFVNLEQLCIYCPKNNSLKQIIDSVTDLKVLSLTHCEYNDITMDIIIKSFQKFVNMEVIQFRCDGTAIQNVISYIEMGLLNCKNNNRKSLKVSITASNKRNITMREIELYIARVMNALDTANINDVMLIFNIPKNLDTNNYRKKIVKHFTQTHLAVTDGNRIIISNKTCKINGYCISSRML